MTAFLKFFDIIPGWVYALVIAGMLVTMGIGEAAHTTEVALLKSAVSKAQGETETAKRLHAEDKARAAEVSRVQSEEFRRLENARQQAMQENTHAVKKELSMVGAGLVLGRSGDDKLRDKLSAYVSPGQFAASEPGALGRAVERAATLRGLLETCRREATEDAGELEGLSAQVRGLIRAYRALDPSPNRIQVNPSPAPVGHTVVDPALPDSPA